MMDVSHLSMDEVEHELLMRNMMYGLDEHESIKRRKLKDKMKHEREKNIFVAAPIWRSVPEEIEIVRAKLSVISGLLDNPRADARQREKLCTRLVHYRVRIYMILKSPGADKHVNEITDLGKQAKQIFRKHFPEMEPVSELQLEPVRLESEIDQALEEVRSEIEILNVTATGNEVEEKAVQTEARGGVKKKSIQFKKQELEASMKRCDEILGVLTGYEEGKQESVKDVLHHFKNFVLNTTQQQKEMREREIALEEKRMKEAEENIERKKRLEKLLITLNDQIKANQENISRSAGEVQLGEIPGGEATSEELNSRDDRILQPTKADEATVSKLLSSEESSTELRAERSKKIKSVREKEQEKRTGGRREKSRRTLPVKSSKKRHRKVSFSSITTSTSTSSSSRTSSSSEASTDSISESSASTSESDERRKKKHKKVRKARKSLRRIPVSEWKLKYDGRDQGRRLAEFLKEVKMRCKSEDVSDRELFRSAIHLFAGRAKDWFMEAYENHDFHSWSGLKRELKREFLPPDLDFQIEIQATGRRQARGERFVDYMHDMQKLFQSMTKPISERRKFEIIWRNMRFDYKNALTGAGVKSLSKLKKYGRIVDENNWNMFQKPSESSNRPKTHQLNEISATNNSKFKPTSSQGDNTRTFFKSKPKSKTDNENRKQEDQKRDKEEKTDKKEDAMEGSSKGTLKALAERYVRPPIGTCYNCRKHGHHYGDCSEKRQKFCRLCGFLDVITPECPFCQKNEQNSA